MNRYYSNNRNEQILIRPSKIFGHDKFKFYNYKPPDCQHCNIAEMKIIFIDYIYSRFFIFDPKECGEARQYVVRKASNKVTNSKRVVDISLL